VSRPVVVAERMSKWYGQVIGLNDVTVSIPSGISGLLGPNGAGKSTLLKLVTGQLKPSQGQVQVLGEPIWDNPGVYRRIGYCPDHDAFYERMTGRDWLTALLGLSGFEGDRAAGAAERALETVGLATAADRRIGGYSKGMRQRIKLAQAIAHEPELLVLDEPLAGLDPIGRRRVIDVIKAWGRDGRSVVVSSHVLHEIELMTSNIVLLHNGRILAEGNVHQIRDLIDEHPHTVRITADDPRRLARHLLGYSHVIAMQLQDGAVIAQTSRPDAFYTELTVLAAGEEAGAVGEVTSPDDNLQAVFSYLVEH
jgi:ABC-2 type transport system ATP-binding protein